MSPFTSAVSGVFLDLATVAMSYAAAGVPVVPLFEPDGQGGCSCRDANCRRPGKHPRNRGGLKNASTDPAIVADWWRTWPTANIGGLTGVVFDVCDVDGPRSAAAVGPLLGACHGVVPLVRTGSGGWHLIFAPTGLGNRVRFLVDTDWRGRDGYVVLPPSVHVLGQQYAVARPAGRELPSVPMALLAALVPAPAAARATVPPAVARLSGYGPSALAREADQVAATKEGGRNDALNRAAFSLGQLIGSGHLTETEVTDALMDAARRAGLTDMEASRTIASGLTAGQKRPRTPRTDRRAA